MTIETRLAEIRARVEAATEGPWFAEDRNLDEPWSTTVVYNVFHNGDTPDRDLVAEAAYDNAEFIAASRTDLPALLAAVEAVMELHQPELYCNNAGHTNPDVACPECVEFCTADEYLYPCPTITALTDALDALDTTREDQTHG